MTDLKSHASGNEWNVTKNRFSLTFYWAEKNGGDEGQLRRGLVCLFWGGHRPVIVKQERGSRHCAKGHRRDRRPIRGATADTPPRTETQRALPVSRRAASRGPGPVCSGGAQRAEGALLTNLDQLSKRRSKNVENAIRHNHRSLLASVKNALG